MRKVAHQAFHKEFSAYLETLNMRPVPGRWARDIVFEQFLDFEELVKKFRPFFDDKPQWKPLFEQEVRALRANKTSLY